MPHAGGEEPRYRRLAAALRAEIAAGRYPVGSRLPTELELCETHEVSRYTAREALRVLREAGLISRRRGAGTTVTAAVGPPAFNQPLGGIDDLLQYARDARLEVSELDDVVADERLAETLGLVRGRRYRRIAGRRIGPDRGAPVGVTRIYVRAELAPGAEDLGALDGAIVELIEARHGLRIARIEQQISAGVLEPDEAARLGAGPGEAALVTQRRYYDERDRLIQASVSIHPAGRFVYSTTARRAAAKPADGEQDA